MLLAGRVPTVQWSVTRQVEILWTASPCVSLWARWKAWAPAHLSCRLWSGRLCGSGESTLLHVFQQSLKARRSTARSPASHLAYFLPLSDLHSWLFDLHWWLTAQLDCCCPVVEKDSKVSEKSFRHKRCHLKGLFETNKQTKKSMLKPSSSSSQVINLRKRQFNGNYRFD